MTTCSTPETDAVVDPQFGAHRGEVDDIASPDPVRAADGRLAEADDLGVL
jgi:hypothetical protein